jgi:hypothetical protein
MLLLCGCSWIHWRENPSGESMIDAGPEKSCSLELAQDRKSLPRRVLALGTPTLLVIRVGTQSEPDRLVRNGQAIYFAAGKLNVEASDFSHAQRTWKIEALDSAGRRLADSVPIVGGRGYAPAKPSGYRLRALPGGRNGKRRHSACDRSRITVFARAMTLLS